MRNFVNSSTATLAALALGCVGATSACDGTSSERVAEEVPATRLSTDGAYVLPTSAASRTFFDTQASRAEAASTIGIDTKLADYLPNRLVAIDGRAEHSVTKGWALGQVTAVDAGQAYGIEGADADRGTPVAFDSLDAAWRIVVVTIDADHFLTRVRGQVVDQPQEVKVGVAIAGEDYVAQMQGIRDLGDVAVVLDNVETHEVAGGIPAVARAGALFGDIDSAGVIGFPALGDASESYVGTLDTASEVVAKSQLPDVHRTLSLVNGTIQQIMPNGLPVIGGDTRP